MNCKALLFIIYNFLVGKNVISDELISILKLKYWRRENISALMLRQIFWVKNWNRRNSSIYDKKNQLTIINNVKINVYLKDLLRKRKSSLQSINCITNYGKTFIRIK